MLSRVSYILFLALLATSSPAFSQSFITTMQGGAEVPGPGDPDGAGTASVIVIGTTVRYTINVSNITLPPTGQHIHAGEPFVAGPVVVALTGVWNGGTLVGSVTTTSATASAIAANPQNFYVNVHTSDFGGGAVRGQLRPFIADIDGNGASDALTDGLLLLRFQFGFRGTTLTNGAIGAGAIRNTPTAIEDYILTLN